ncbi:unnamed protein product [Caenorhabditis auriculariae]|uniref:Uncharacterized protein n=1 Tax=Caenorhabditis auriculariae TaxID=2777116 RepID=A0A8S1HL80_9PELO|nr:unnamed protein product [Caenorhabditis auriculariae]
MSQPEINDHGFTAFVICAIISVTTIFLHIGIPFIFHNFLSLAIVGGLVALLGGKNILEKLPIFLEFLKAGLENLRAHPSKNTAPAFVLLVSSAFSVLRILWNFSSVERMNYFFGIGLLFVFAWKMTEDDRERTRRLELENASLKVLAASEKLRLEEEKLREVSRLKNLHRAREIAAKKQILTMELETRTKIAITEKLKSLEFTQNSISEDCLEIIKQNAKNDSSDIKKAERVLEHLESSKNYMEEIVEAEKLDDYRESIDQMIKVIDQVLMNEKSAFDALISQRKSLEKASNDFSEEVYQFQHSLANGSSSNNNYIESFVNRLALPDVVRSEQVQKRIWNFGPQNPEKPSTSIMVRSRSSQLYTEASSRSDYIEEQSQDGFDEEFEEFRYRPIRSYSSRKTVEYGFSTFMHCFLFISITVFLHLAIPYTFANFLSLSIAFAFCYVYGLTKVSFECWPQCKSLDDPNDTFFSYTIFLCIAISLGRILWFLYSIGLFGFLYSSSWSAATSLLYAALYTPVVFIVYKLFQYFLEYLQENTPQAVADELLHKCRLLWTSVVLLVLTIYGYFKLIFVNFFS